ncbi:pyridoxal 5'-phosphate synthase (glutamine hydrolyzing) [Malassezia nana]|uniref:glutaminase n=1 Tax=Malassezia nana TaxID=180528 RepID=A0AAF0EHR0_9BASI|nr:pyridoxal 5'-phosphate synthase (glutamine hydrolyzing) [Malassezia nana]
MSATVGVTIGVLALQGAFHEHMARFASLNASASNVTVRSIAVRRPEQLAQCDALVLPGGESTAIALGMHNAKLIEPLREWIRDGKPVWGTCAGMIMLADTATGGKRGGQELLGGLHIQVGRNGFGSQVNSFECDVQCPALGDAPFPGVFIRAPIVEALGAAHPDATLPISHSPAAMHDLFPDTPVQPLAWLPSAPGSAPGTDPASIVAVRQGRLLATSFHPELTTDTRLHSYFVHEVVLS